MGIGEWYNKRKDENNRKIVEEMKKTRYTDDFLKAAKRYTGNDTHILKEIQKVKNQHIEHRVNNAYYADDVRKYGKKYEGNNIETLIRVSNAYNNTMRKNKSMDFGMKAIDLCKDFRILEHINCKIKKSRKYPHTFIGQVLDKYANNPKDTITIVGYGLLKKVSHTSQVNYAMAILENAQKLWPHDNDILINLASATHFRARIVDGFYGVDVTRNESTCFQGNEEIFQEAIRLYKTLYDRVGQESAIPSGLREYVISGYQKTHSRTYNRRQQTTSPPSGGYYNKLGINQNTPYEDAKKEYRKLAMKYHPDRNKGSKEAEDKLKEITEAWREVKKHLPR